MTYDWEPYKEICYRMYVEEKKTLKQVHAFLKDNHNFTPSLRGLHHRVRQWKFPSKHNPAYKNEALVTRIRELWETNHQARDMLAILQDEGFDVQDRDIIRVRQKNGWLLRMDPAHLKKRKRPVSQGPGPEEGSGDESEDEGEGVDDAGAHSATGLGNFLSDTLADIDLTQTEAAAFQEARKRAIAAEAEEKRATKKRRRWLKSRAGLPADPPGPPRFPSELSLTECKQVLSLDAETYRDVRAKFQRVCEEEGVTKKTLAGPQKWEAIKLQLIRESMHLRSVFWDNLNMDQRNLALDLICCDVTKNIRQAGSRMMLHEARNLLGLNPKMGRDVRLHFHRILAEDRFAGKILAGEEHWNELRERWLSESEILQPIAASLNPLDPSFTQMKKALDAVARDAMKRFRDADTRGMLSKLLEQDLDGQGDQQDAHGETDHEVGGNDEAIDMSAFDGGLFGDDEASQIAAQLSMPAHNPQSSDSAMPAGSDQGPLDAAEPSKKKRGRPRKHARPESGLEGTASSETSVKKRRGRTSKRIPQEEALAIYAHSQARFLPPDEASGPGLPAPAAPGGVNQQQQYTPAPIPAAAPASTPSSPARAPIAPPTQAQARAQVVTSTPAPPPAQRLMVGIYFRPAPSSTAQGAPGMWISTLSSCSLEELRAKAVAKTPGAVCGAVDGIVKDRPGGSEVPLPIPGDGELEAYLDHMREVYGPPVFSVELVQGP